MITKNPTHITTKMLKELEACRVQIELFRKTFGDSAKLNAKNVKKAAKAELNLEWLFEKAKLSGVFIDKYGVKLYYLNGELHREDGPAAECSNGDKYWYLNGIIHREDGPAVECSNGNKYWYLNGKRVK